MRVTAKKTLKNKTIKGVYRSAIKKTHQAVTDKKVKTAQEWLKKSIQALDKAAQKKVLKKNTAARYKSHLNKLVKGLVKK